MLVKQQEDIIQLKLDDFDMIELSINIRPKQD